MIDSLPAGAPVKLRRPWADHVPAPAIGWVVCDFSWAPDGLVEVRWLPGTLSEVRACQLEGCSPEEIRQLELASLEGL